MGERGWLIRWKWGLTSALPLALVELGFRVAGSVRSGEDALALAARAPPSLA